MHPAWALVAATALWGLASAVVAESPVAGVTSAALVTLGGALALLVLVRPRGGPPRHVVLLGVTEACNIGFFYAGLAVGPVAPVIAAHLSTPVLLLGGALVRDRRRPSPREALVLVLMVGGLATTAVRASEGDGVLLGTALGLLSAVTLTGMVVLIARTATRGTAVAAAAWQLAVGGLVLSPALVLAPPEGEEALALLLTGAVCTGPAFALYWRGVGGGLRARTAATLGLLEAVWAVALVLVLFGEAPTALELLAALAFLAAVTLAVRADPSGAPTDDARSPAAAARAPAA